MYEKIIAAMQRGTPLDIAMCEEAPRLVTAFCTAIHRECGNASLFGDVEVAHNTPGEIEELVEAVFIKRLVAAIPQHSRADIICSVLPTLINGDTLTDEGRDVWETIKTQIAELLREQASK
ncbi:hypothetical protein DVA43_02445 [Leclercia sp. W6]|uniref:hypothetical protein n=1 Tax=Leclercia sp. W6 TaxID=2282310 RepID=UPI000DF16856|nr:hypothetical protein [Leclercia sp. W6]AXF58494.1 hypothetical protein DVA43_02445 [Leclercia sp. W6]